MREFISKYYSGIFVLFLVVIVGLSFWLGYKEGQGTQGVNPIVFSCPNTVLEAQKIPLSKAVSVTAENTVATAVSAIEPASSEQNTNGGAYVGSKNGTKYYTPGCPGTKRIKPENYVWFQSAEDATLQGYSKGSC